MKKPFLMVRSFWQMPERELVTVKKLLETAQKSFTHEDVGTVCAPDATYRVENGSCSLRISALMNAVVVKIFSL